MTSIERVFLDRRKPCLAQATRVIFDRAVAHGPAGEIDLAHVLIVTPGARAARNLRAQLLAQATARGVPFIPPPIVTPGALPAVFGGRDVPVATEDELRFAWEQAVGASSPAVLEALGTDSTSMNDVVWRRQFASVLFDLSRDLGGAMRRFADVLEYVASHGPVHQVERWEALALIEKQFRSRLEEAGLGDVHDAVANAPGDHHRCERIVLIGVVEMNPMQRRLLDLTDMPVISLVHGEESSADQFDGYGCVVPSAWSEASIAIDDAFVHRADRPGDQVQCALSILAEMSESVTADEVSIGVGDPVLAPALVRGGWWSGVQVHLASGEPLARSAPLALLEALAEWLENRRISNLLMLLRHPDVERWIDAHVQAQSLDIDLPPGRWLAFVEAYFERHLHEHADGAWLGSATERARMEQIHNTIESLAGELTHDAPRAMSDWARGLMDLLASVYGDLQNEQGRRDRTVEACMQLAAALDTVACAAVELQPLMHAHEALRWLLNRVDTMAGPSPVRENQVDALGWLELHLDTAPNLILTGFNDGNIPSTVLGHPFLPDQLRASLGLSSNTTRVARDAYLLDTILRSRKHVHLIVGARDQDDTPIAPSRFLFASDPVTIHTRVKRFFGDDAAQHARLAHPRGLAAPARATQFLVPPVPEEAPLPTSMRVTDFRAYLECPYRFALSRLVRVERPASDRRELDALRFGHLAHEVLERFGRDATLRDVDDAREIDTFLQDTLSDRAKLLFGSRPSPALAVQLAHLRQRLRDFSHWQASTRRAGWRIHDVEIAHQDDVALTFPDDEGAPPMPLRGQIDRIDIHEREDTARVIDYKTGERQRTPNETHIGCRVLPDDPASIKWRDLQLPLYHYLVRERDEIDVSTLTLGYIALPKRTNGTALLKAEWSNAHLQSALTCARAVVRSIRKREFTPATIAPSAYDDFARICQVNVFGGAGEEEDEEAIDA